MIWSSCREPVPPILNRSLGFPLFALAAPMYSLALLYGVSALTHSTNWSSASIATGVRSRQLNGTPVASGVVNRFDSVMMILCGSPLAPLTSRNPSAPAPPALLMTTIDCFIRLCFWMIAWLRRAIWSAPPPVPAGTMNSTVFVGSQPWACTAPAPSMPATNTAAARNEVEVRVIRSSKDSSPYVCRRFHSGARGEAQATVDVMQSAPYSRARLSAKCLTPVKKRGAPPLAAFTPARSASQPRSPRRRRRRK